VNAYLGLSFLLSAVAFATASRRVFFSCTVLRIIVNTATAALRELIARETKQEKKTRLEAVAKATAEEKEAQAKVCIHLNIIITLVMVLIY